VILLPGAVRVYFATAPVNLRRSFDGLSNEVRAVLGREPLSGHVFVFLNRRKTQVKLLLWTRGGYTIVHKRLEQGRFAFPQQVTSQAACVALDVHELGMLLEGIDMSRVRISRWTFIYKRPKRCCASPGSDLPHSGKRSRSAPRRLRHVAGARRNSYHGVWCRSR
jgi:transposase